MATKVSIVLEVIDKLSKPFAAMEKSVNKFFNQTGLTELHKRAAKAGEAWQKVGSQVTTGLKWAGGALAAYAGTAFYMVDRLTDQIESLTLTAKRLNIDTTTLQEFRYVAERSQLSIETMDNAFWFLSRNMGEALRDVTSPSAKAFHVLGVHLKDSAGKVRSLDSVFLDLLDAMKLTRSEQERDSIAQEIFGRGAKELGNILTMSRQDFDSLRKAAHDYGLILDKDVIKNGNQARDVIEQFKGRLKGLTNTLSVALIPVVEKYVNMANKWLANNKALIGVKIDEYLDRISKTLDDLIPKMQKWAGRADSVAQSMGGWENVAWYAVIAAALKWVIELVASLGVAIWTTAKIVPVIYGMAKGLFAYLYAAGATALSWIASFLGTSVAVASLVVAEILAIIGYVAYIWNRSRKYGMSFLDTWILTGQAMGKWIRDKLWDYFGEFAVHLGMKIAEGVDWLKSTLSDIIDWIKSAWTDTIGWLEAKAKKLKSLLPDWVTGGESTITVNPTAAMAGVAAGQQQFGGVIDVRFNNAPAGTTATTTRRSNGLELQTGIWGVQP